jgi:hypothetical protein
MVNGDINRNLLGRSDERYYGRGQPPNSRKAVLLSEPRHGIGKKTLAEPNFALVHDQGQVRPADDIIDCAAQSSIFSKENGDKLSQSGLGEIFIVCVLAIP